MFANLSIDDAAYDEFCEPQFSIVELSKGCLTVEPSRMKIVFASSQSATGLCLVQALFNAVALL